MALEKLLTTLVDALQVLLEEGTKANIESHIDSFQKQLIQQANKLTVRQEFQAPSITLNFTFAENSNSERETILYDKLLSRYPEIINGPSTKLKKMINDLSRWSHDLPLPSKTMAELIAFRLGPSLHDYFYLCLQSYLSEALAWRML